MQATKKAKKDTPATLITVSNRRSVMTLYSGFNDLFSHQIRIMLAEKSIGADIIPISPENLPEDFIYINPYNTVPTLIDRDLILYEPAIIVEYLDERYPHPPLLPVYPVARAKARLLMYRIQRDWYSLLNTIFEGDKRKVEKARQHLKDALLEVSPLFGDMVFFMSEEFSLIDCYILPLLWRLPVAGIKLSTKSINEYCERMFDRRSFVLSLTPEEKSLR